MGAQHHNFDRATGRQRMTPISGTQFSERVTLCSWLWRNRFPVLLLLVSLAVAYCQWSGWRMIVEQLIERSTPSAVAHVGSSPPSTGLGHPGVLVRNDGGETDRPNPELAKRSSSFSPELVLRFALIPMLLWIAKNLVAYAFRRHHALRSLYADAFYRLGFAEQAVRNIRKGLEDFEIKNPMLPTSLARRENHFLYQSLQADLKECTWGNEVAAIRLLYRSLDQIDGSVDVIARRHEKALELSRKVSDTTTSNATALELKRLVREIGSEAHSIQDELQFWKKVRRLARKRMPLKRFGDCIQNKPRPKWAWVLRSVMLPQSVWWSVFLVAPLSAIVLAVWILLFFRIDEIFSWSISISLFFVIFLTTMYSTYKIFDNRPGFHVVGPINKEMAME